LKRDTANTDARRASVVQFIKFGIVGFSNTAIGYLIYYPMVYVGAHYLVASVTSFIISVLNAFFWSNKYVFKRRDDEKRDIWGALLKTFASYAFTGLVLQNVLLLIFIDVLRVGNLFSGYFDPKDSSKYIAPVFCLAVTVPLNFILNKKWVFRNRGAV